MTSRLGQKVRVPGGGGEGPWYTDNGCGYVDIDGVTGDKYVVWGRQGGGGGITATGPATISTIVTTLLPRIWEVDITGTGAVVISQDACDFGGILVHLFPTGSPIETSCG